MGKLDKIYIDDELPEPDETMMCTHYIVRNQGLRSTWEVCKDDCGHLYWVQVSRPVPDTMYVWRY